MSAPVHNERLAALQRFRDAVWGNKHIFTKRVTRAHRQSGSNPRIVEYLDFGEHHGAVHSICSALEEEKLLVVQEYREAMSNFRIDDRKYNKGACILGQSGIGKSCFIPYAVVELLRERQPVAVQVTWDEQRSQYILLSENGIWAFSDSNESVLAPTVAFTKTLGVRTFQTTFPDGKRYKDWTKQNGVQLYFMDLLPTKEIEDLAFILGLNVKHISKAAQKWGPVLRALLPTPEEETAYQDAVKNTCMKATREPVHAVTNFNGSLDLGSSNVFFVKPKGKDIIHRSDYFVWVPTSWLFSQLGEQLELSMEADDTRFNFFNIPEESDT